MATNSFTRLSVQELDERIVPAAMLDLTKKAAMAPAAGAIVRQVDAQPTGTGYIRSFVRLQGAANGGGTQQGYNTSARPLQFDENNSPQFTRNLRLSQVSKTVEGGVTYRQFLLDVNQKASASKLSLDEVRIYVGQTDSLTGYDAATKKLAGMTPVFDLDAGGDVSVMLDARLNNGSGSGDMMLLVPDANFASSAADGYVYLYSKMGGATGASANGGFEEWAVPLAGSTGDGGGGTGGGGGGSTGTATASIGGTVWIDTNYSGPGRDADDVGLADVVITLQGVDDLGNTVVLTTTTDSNGNYRFDNLRAGTYTLMETQPDNYTDSDDYIGTLGGSLFGTDGIMDIHVADGAIGTGYDFSEYYIINN